jgi:hypothetical protein
MIGPMRRSVVQIALGRPRPRVYSIGIPMQPPTYTFYRQQTFAISPVNEGK